MPKGKLRIFGLTERNLGGRSSRQIGNVISHGTPKISKTLDYYAI
jgi:hypothetical protein